MNHLTSISAISALLAAICSLSNLTAQTWLREVNAFGLAARALAVDDHGRVAVMRINGYSGGVTLFDASGAVLADYDIDADDSSQMKLTDGKFLNNGLLALCGAIGNYPWVAAVDPMTGNPVWQTTLTSGSTHGYLSRMRVNKLGHAVCTGVIEAPNGTNQRVFVAGVRENGGTAYRREFGIDRASSHTTASNGDMIFASSGAGSFCLTRTSNFANPVWRRAYTSGKPTIAPQVLETNDGDLCTVGVFLHSATPTTNQYRFTISKMSPNGTRLWRRDIDSMGSTQFTVLHDIGGAAATTDGGIVAAVTQPAPGGAERDAALLRFDRYGNVLWMRSFGKAGINDSAIDVVSTPDNGFIALAKIDNGFRVLRADFRCNAGGCSIAALATSTLQAPTTNDQGEPFSYASYGDPWGNLTTTPSPANNPVTNVCGTNCSVGGGPFGAGTAGTGSIVPRLDSTPGGCLGYTPKLVVEDAVGGVFGILGFNFAPANVSVAGATVLVDPNGLIVQGFFTSGSFGAAGHGTATLPIAPDLTGLIGVTFYTQALLLDAGATGGVSASNGVTLTIQ